MSKSIKYVIVLITLVFFSACSSSKNSIIKFKKEEIIADRVVANALKYKGVKYKFGGTTTNGMDCSGVVFVAFGEEQIKLPRVSRFMAQEGTPIPLKEVKKGDLLFFETNRNKKRINHVGLIISTRRNEILFIHATSSKGVVVSSLSEDFWQKTFVKATTIL